MPLEELISLIERLKNRIDQHGVLLRQNETMTRYALIDPMLRELGWDTGDPGIVRPEYRDAGGYADYALMRNNRPVALVEAKKLGEPLASGTEQVLNYCNQQGINYMVVTDGDRWELYEVFRQARIEDRKLMSFSIRNEQGYECALKALHIWQPNLSTVTSITKPPEIVIAGIPSIQSAGPPLEQTSPSNVRVVNSEDDAQWKPIKEIGSTRGLSAPKAMRWSDGQQTEVKYWRDLLREVAKRLVELGHLTINQCPISRTQWHYIVHTEPLHPTGDGFGTAHQLPNGLYLSVNSGQAVKDSQILLQACNQDLQTVLVRFS